MSTQPQYSLIRHPNMAIRHAPAISNFPWHNGILLTVGSMRPEIDALVMDRPNISEGERIIVEKLAEYLDGLDIDKTIFDKRINSFTRLYLEADISELTNPHRWEKSNSSDLIVATHTLLSLGLLDRLCDAVCLTKSSYLSTIPRSNLPPLTEKFSNLLHRIDHWNTPLEELLIARHSVNSDLEIQEERLFESPLPNDLSLEQKSIVSSVKMFSRGATAFKASKWNSVKSNFEMMAFAIVWYGQGHQVHVGNDDEQWAKDFISRAEAVGLPLQADFIKDLMDDSIGGTMYSHMRNMFHMCVAISPLFSLLSRSFAHAKISRDKVIAASISFGNNRPMALADIERAIWRGLMRVALGSDAETELNKVLGDYQLIMQGGDLPGPSLEWYSTKATITGPVPADSSSSAKPPHITPSSSNRRSQRLQRRQDTNETISSPSVRSQRRRIDEDEEDASNNSPEGEPESASDHVTQEAQPPFAVKRKQHLITGPDSEHGKKTLSLPDVSIISLTEANLGEKTLSKYPIPEMEQAGITLKLFGATSEDPVMEHTYYAPKKTAYLEYPALKRIQDSVEKMYVDGQPLHHLPSAWDSTYNPTASSIFVVDHAAFEEMPDKTIQDIFRHRHILVRGTPGKSLRFDASGLSTLAPLHKHVQFQVAELRGDAGREDLLRVGTLKELIEATSDPSKRRILNGLDFPLSHVTRPPPPRFRHVSLVSHELALHHTNGMMGFPTRHLQAEDLHWGLAATRGSTSMVHIDDDGLATFIKIMSGSKWWVLMRSKRGTPADDQIGDLSSIKCFPLTWEHGDTGNEMFEAEAIHLRETDVLYMRPNTPHYVLGVEDTITYGGHFYCTSTIADSCFSVIHTFILNATLTNQEHEGTRALLRRMMAMWASQYVDGLFEAPDEIKAHIPDIFTAEGFLDVILLGCIIEFSDAISREHHKGIVPKDVTEEETSARLIFRSFMRRMDLDHISIIQGNPVGLWYIVRRYILQFSVALCCYVKRWDSSELSPIINADKMGAVVSKHISMHWPELYQRFKHMRHQDQATSTSFKWDGPRFDIWLKAKVPSWMPTPTMDWVDDPVFWTEGENDHESEDGSEAMVVSESIQGKRRRETDTPKGLSQSPDLKRLRQK